MAWVHDEATGLATQKVPVDGIGYDTAAHLSSQINEAQAVRSRLRAFVRDLPELVESVERISAALERADAYDLRRDDAVAALRAAEEERDAAERVAIAKGKDPAAAAKSAARKVDEARKAVEDAERHYQFAVAEVTRAAAAAQGRLKELLKQNARKLLVSRLVEFERLRKEALDAVRDAREKLALVGGYFNEVKGMAAIDPDEELSRMVLSSRFDVHSRKINSNRMTFEAALQEMDTFASHRLVYRDSDLYSGMPSPLGEKFGRAVEIAREELGENE